MKIFLRIVKKLYPNLDIKYLSGSPLLFFYSCYLTKKYFNSYIIFPAIKFNGKVQFRIYKRSGAKICIKGQLILEKWLNGNDLAVINLSANAVLEIDNDFVIGDGVKIHISENGVLKLKGKNKESASGITADSVIMVNKYLEIGEDCLIAWNTFITDCDWHGIEGKQSTKQTKIKDHVWIGVGAKVLKGVIIENDCIITSNTVVTQGIYKQKSMISGVPGIVVKSNIPTWRREINSYDGTK